MHWHDAGHKTHIVRHMWPCCRNIFDLMPRAGVIIVLSTAYRVWAVWWYAVPLPIAAFGSHLHQENVDFRHYQVTRLRKIPGSGAPVVAFPCPKRHITKCVCIHAHRSASCRRAARCLEFLHMAPQWGNQRCRACLQFHLHYPLLCRAASLAIGCLTALPLLDSCCWRAAAPRQQSASGRHAAAALQHCNNESSSSSRRDQGPAHSSGDGSAAPAAGNSTDAGTVPQLSAMPPMVVILGEHRAAAPVLTTPCCTAVTLHARCSDLQDRRS